MIGPSHRLPNRRHAGLTLALLLAASACGPPSPPPLTWHGEGELHWLEATPRGGGPGFTSLDPEKTGIGFVNTFPTEELNQNRVLANGSGVTLGDVQGDGWTDVVLAGIDGRLALYRNLGGWQFREVTAEAGLRSDPRRHYTGVVLADVDGDGALDLLVAAVGAPLTLYRNDGSGRFAKATARAGLSGLEGGSTPTLADVDGDGDLDLYVSNYKRRFAVDALGPEPGFRLVRTGDEGPELTPEATEHYALEIHPELRTTTLRELAEPDWFFENEGDGRFRHVPFTSGRFRGPDGEALLEEPVNFGLSARFHDLDGDGDPDLYVCNDFGDPDGIWLNDGRGAFIGGPAQTVRTTSLSSMGMDLSDLDRDGDVDVIVVDMLPVDPVERRSQIPPRAPLLKKPGGDRVVDQISRNVLLVSRGDGTFAQVADFAGVAASDWSWTPIFLDVDLDGYEDLLVTNGFRWDATNGDAQRQAPPVLAGAPAARAMTHFERLEQRNRAFRNGGDLTFERRPDWGFGAEEDISLGMAAGDLDNDGDLDVVASRWDAPPAVYRNDAAEPRVAIRLRGSPPNTAGIGALIRVEGGPVLQTKEVTLGGHYLSSSDPVYAFAAGDADRLTARVRWRDGSWTGPYELRPGRIYEIRREAGGGGIERVGARASDGPLPPLFEDASAQLAGHEHQEALFDDFDRQPLLPDMLSRFGPGITWTDVDGDGDDDLLVPGGTGDLSAFRNDAGTLSPWPGFGVETGLEQTMALPWRTGRATRLLVGQSNYDEGGGFRPLVAVAPAVGIDLLGGRAGQPRPMLAPDTATAGPLALADVDADGDLDLFVGSRTVPGRYPLHAPSRVHLAEGGRFTPAPGGTLPDSLGMVSGAAFSDLDTDGDPDLVLAVDWGPPRVLLNEGGRFRDATQELGLGGLVGRWNGVGIGGLNGDGRPDVVLTNRGLNTSHGATPERPLLLYAADFDRNGVMDPLLARYDSALDAETPLHSLPVLQNAIPSLRRRIPTFEAFATATLEEVAGPYLSRASRLGATTLAHVALLSRAGGGYDIRPLPPEAQWAPAFGVVVADLDGDGHEDVLLAQNFFATPPGEPRYDAGVGLLLQGDGTGDLTPVPARESGIRAFGEQRGAAVADFDGDGRLDVALAQNGAPTRLFRNAGGAPGLRVRLVGPGPNPTAVGARLRAVYRDGSLGPAREIRSGTGYWSHDSPIQILGARSRIVGVEIRWPDGSRSPVEVPLEAAEVAVRHPSIRSVVEPERP